MTESELGRAGDLVQAGLHMARVRGNAMDSATLRLPDLGPVTHSLPGEAIQMYPQWQCKA